LGLFPKDFL
jgi:hypothetical protein